MMYQKTSNPASFYHGHNYTEKIYNAKRCADGHENYNFDTTT